MSDGELETIIGEVRKALEVLARLHGYLSTFLTERLPAAGKTTDSAFIVAGAMENYYTAAETLFVRLSQSFENQR